MIKTFLASLLTLTFAFADAHILVYHRFDDPRHASTNISIKNLKEQFEYFKNNGYEVVKLSKLVEALNLGQEIPDNWIVITIDDGYKSFYDKALEVFKEYNYPFAMLIYVEAVAGKYSDYLTFDQLKELEAYGEIRHHPYPHPTHTTLTLYGQPSQTVQLPATTCATPRQKDPTWPHNTKHATAAASHTHLV